MIKINDPSNVKDLKTIENEEILLKVKVSNILLYAPLSILLVSFFLLFKINLLFSGLFFIMNLFCVYLVSLYIRNSFIYITKTKLHYYFGVFANNSDVLLINKINKIEVRQSIFDMVCNTGNVYLITNSGERESFYFIEKHKILKTQISQIF